MSLGQAFIDIHANTKAFEAEIKRLETGPLAALQAKIDAAAGGAATGTGAGPSTAASSAVVKAAESDDAARVTSAERADAAIVASDEAASEERIKLHRRVRDGDEQVEQAEIRAAEEADKRKVASAKAAAAIEAAEAKQVAAAFNDLYLQVAEEAKAAGVAQKLASKEAAAQAAADAAQIAAAFGGLYEEVSAEAKAAAAAQRTESKETAAQAARDAAEVAAAWDASYKEVVAEARAAAVAQKAASDAAAKSALTAATTQLAAAKAIQKASLTGAAANSLAGSIKDIPGDIFDAITTSAKFATIGVLALGVALAGIGLVSAAKQQAAVVGFTALAAQISATYDATTGLTKATVGLSQAQATVIGQKFEDQLIQLSNNSALAQTAIQDTTQSLLALGFNGTQALGIIRDIGNALAASGKTGGGLNDDLKGIVVAFTQIKGAGRLLAQDLNQITTRIPSVSRVQVYVELAKALKLAGANAKEGTPAFNALLVQVQKLAKEGKISSDVAIPAIIKALKEVPGAAKDAETGLDALGRQNLTLTGRFEALKDNVRSALAKAFLLPGTPGGPAGNSLADGLAAEIGAAIPAITSAIKRAGPALSAFVTDLGGTLFKILPPLLALIGKLFDELGRALNSIDLTGLLDGLSQLGTKGTDANTAISSLATVLRELYQVAVALSPVASGIAKGFAALAGGLASLEPIVRVLSEAFKAIAGSGIGQGLIALGTVAVATRIGMILLSKALLAVAASAVRATATVRAFGTAGSLASVETRGLAVSAAALAAATEAVSVAAAEVTAAEAAVAATTAELATAQEAAAGAMANLALSADAVAAVMTEVITAETAAAAAAARLTVANEAAAVSAAGLATAETGVAASSAAAAAGGVAAAGGLAAVASSATIVIPILIAAGVAGYALGNKLTEGSRKAAAAMQAAQDNATKMAPAFDILFQHTGDLGVSVDFLSQQLSGLGIQTLADTFTTGQFTDTVSALINALESQGDSAATVVKKLEAMGISSIDAQNAVKGLGTGIAAANADLAALSTDAARAQLRALEIQALQTAGAIRGVGPGQNPFAPDSNDILGAGEISPLNQSAVDANTAATALSDQADTVAAALTGGADTVASAAKAAADKLKTARTALSKELAGFVKDVAGASVDDVRKALSTLKADVKDVATGAIEARLVAAISKARGQLVGLAKDLAHVTATLTAAQGRFTEVSDSIKSFASVSSIDLGSIGLAATDATTKLADLSRLRIILPGQDTLNKITGGSAGADAIAAGSAKFAAALADRLKTIQDFQANIQKLIDEGLNKTTIDQVISAGPDAGGTLAQSLAGASKATVDSINATQAAIDKAAADLGNTAADSLFRAGKSVVSGLIQGLKDNQAEITAAMKGIANALVEQIKKALKLHSPSRRMAEEVGQHIIPGLLAPINANGHGLVRDAMSRIGDTMAANTPTLAPLNLDALAGLADAQARLQLDATLAPSSVQLLAPPPSDARLSLGSDGVSDLAAAISTARAVKEINAPITQHFHGVNADPHAAAKALAKAVGGLR